MPKTAAGLPPEKKSKSANGSSPSGKEKVALMTQEEMHGKIKIIPPKPKRKCSVFVLTYPVCVLSLSTVPEKSVFGVLKQCVLSHTTAGRDEYQVVMRCLCSVV